MVFADACEHLYVNIFDAKVGIYFRLCIAVIIIIKIVKSAIQYCLNPRI